MTKLLSENSEIANELPDNSPDAMMTLSPIAVYWNKGAENTFGYYRDEAIGRELSDQRRIILPTEPGAIKV